MAKNRTVGAQSRFTGMNRTWKSFDDDIRSKHSDAQVICHVLTWLAILDREKWVAGTMYLRGRKKLSDYLPYVKLNSERDLLKKNYYWLGN